MSVRKRSWKSPGGETKEAWVVDYVDQGGARHLKTFARKREADAWHTIVARDVRAGIHTAESKSPTVTTAARLWLESGEAAKLERATLMSYQANVDLHIVPLVGAVKLSALTVPMVRAFEDRLRADRSPAMVRRVMGALGSILADAQERGLVAQNVVRSLRGSRRRDKDRHADKRQKGKLKVGVDIPTPDEIRAIIAHLHGRRRPMLLTAIFTGLRASELRGLRWADINLKRGELHVRQRADRFNTIGRPKSESGERTIPLAPMLVNTLREWSSPVPRAISIWPSPMTAATSITSPTSWAQPTAGPGRGGRGQRGGQGEVSRPACSAPLLRLMVHQSPRRRRPRTAAQAGPKPARALDR